eukprot:2788174-Rhodomonas_salina.1
MEQRRSPWNSAAFRIPQCRTLCTRQADYHEPVRCFHVPAEVGVKWRSLHTLRAMRYNGEGQRLPADSHRTEQWRGRGETVAETAGA